MADKPELNYEEDIRIDPHALDLELLNQASRFMRYSIELADARDRLARAEQAADIEAAEANKRVRERLKETKATVDQVKAEVAVDAEYKKKCDTVLSLKHEVDVLAAAVTAFNHRKSALENLVTLHGQQYFAGPRIPNDIGREFVRGAKERARADARDRAAEHSRRT